MTTITETSLKPRVLEYIGEPANVGLDSVGGFSDRLRKVAQTIGANVEQKGLSFDGAVGVISEAIDALDAVVAKPAQDSRVEALKALAAEKEAALAKLEALQRLLNLPAETAIKTESVLELEQFKFRRINAGQVEFIIPKGMSVIQAFEILNVEAARLGINPAVYAGDDYDWYKKNTKAAEVQKDDLKVVLSPVAEGSLGASRGKMEQGYNLPDMGNMALANALEWVASSGKINSFVDDKGSYIWVRGNVPGFALYRYACGVGVDRGDDFARGGVGCSSGPN